MCQKRLGKNQRNRPEYVQDSIGFPPTLWLDEVEQFIGKAPRIPKGQRDKQGARGETPSKHRGAPVEFPEQKAVEERTAKEQDKAGMEQQINAQNHTSGEIARAAVEKHGEAWPMMS